MAVLGIDEVGRGPLAGPLVVGAVILPQDERTWFSELKDSKKLSIKKRETLNELILAESTTGLGWVAAEELDKLGITESLRLATRRAVKQIQSLHTPFSQIIIDGNLNFLANTPLEKYTSTLIKADAKIREVSAASIIAKVARDHYMIELAAKYPDYDFDKHVGYGTKTHIEAIYKHGLTPEHRKSFEPCKSISGFTPPVKSTKNTTKIGHQAESAVAEYLKSKGHAIVEQNHKTPYYEIDLISTKDDKIYFTEVKYRKNSTHGNGLDAITTAKLDQMHFAALSYLKYQNTKYKTHQPLLAAASVSGDLTSTNPQITWFPLS